MSWIDLLAESKMQSGRQTEEIAPSPVGCLVTTSHFSGVVTIICVSAISFFVSCMSPNDLIQSLLPRDRHEHTSQLPNLNKKPP